MNIIYKLFDEQFVKDYFKKELLPLYPSFNRIKKVVIKAPKKNIWEKTYHVVIEFSVYFLTPDNKEKKLPIYCSAHTCEPRKNVYDSLRFLWDNGFNRGYLTIPHPLFYSKKFKGVFYRGVKGKNLYRYIRNKNYDQISEIIPKTAAWFAKLHNLPVEKAQNFNPKNSRLKTVVPGVKHIVERIGRDYPEYEDLFVRAYNIFIKKENNFLSSTDKRWLVHGDAHPENIIKMGKKKIGVIDFTDLCLSDFTRDLGTFFQQFEYMCQKKNLNDAYVKETKKVFIDNYLVNVNMNIGEEDFERIDNYYNWTAIRTIAYFLTKHNPEPENAIYLIEKIKNKLNIE